MTQDATKVRIDKPQSAGAVYLAPAATTLPTDNSTTLAITYVAVGYLDPAGITETPTRQSTAIYAYGGDQVAVAESQDGLTVEFTMIETNDASLKAYWGSANVATASGITTAKSTAAEFLHQVMVIETVSNSVKSRRVYPDVKVSDRGASVSTDDAARMYPITFAAFPDTNGVKRYEYTGTATT